MRAETDQAKSWPCRCHGSGVGHLGHGAMVESLLGDPNLLSSKMVASNHQHMGDFLRFFFRLVMMVNRFTRNLGPGIISATWWIDSDLRWSKGMSFREKSGEVTVSPETWDGLPARGFTGQVSWNGGTQKRWMVDGLFQGKSQSKMDDDLEYPYFQETS